MSVLFCVLIYYVIVTILCTIFFQLELHKPGMIDYYDNEPMWQEFTEEMRNGFLDARDSLLKQINDWEEKEDFTFDPKTPEENVLVNMFGYRVMETDEEGTPIHFDDTEKVIVECTDFCLAAVNNDHYVNVFKGVEFKKTLFTAIIPFYRVYQLIEMCKVNGAYEDMNA